MYGVRARITDGIRETGDAVTKILISTLLYDGNPAIIAPTSGL